jgi:exosome complex component CSL4
LNSKENVDIKKILDKIPKQRALEEGDVVTGVIVQTTDKIAILSLEATKKQHILTPSSSGVIFIRNASDDYVEKMGDVVRIGDIVKAKIVEVDKFGFKFAINEEELGVLQSNCSKCKTPLILDSTSIKCLKCNTINLKKIAKV